MGKRKTKAIGRDGQVNRRATRKPQKKREEATEPEEDREENIVDERTKDTHVKHRVTGTRSQVQSQRTKPSVCCTSATCRDIGRYLRYAGGRAGERGRRAVRQVQIPHGHFAPLIDNSIDSTARDATSAANV